jgi:hypothetical protein
MERAASAHIYGVLRLCRRMGIIQANPAFSEKLGKEQKAA